MSFQTNKGTSKFQCEVGFKTDPELDKIIREKLIQARVSLLIKHPFFGTLATRLELVNADDWLPTAATDGRRFYYNTKFVDAISKAFDLFDITTFIVIGDSFLNENLIKFFKLVPEPEIKTAV